MAEADKQHIDVNVIDGILLESGSDAESIPDPPRKLSVVETKNVTNKHGKKTGKGNKKKKGKGGDPNIALSFKKAKLIRDITSGNTNLQKGVLQKSNFRDEKER
ncbi:hypothetical protein LOD99_10829 [Oopsacas minuta]|uniref:Uncharacterized protein n=1 Tax=Oopsacas minuta TaxID=111878 RepID=A0AAV7KFE1_9METZ|nr:hypothetical protein LOD99_10829 [Oopsacas minuta]